MSSMPDGYEIREMTFDQFNPLWRKHAPTVFGETSIFPLREVLNEAELAKMGKLQERMGEPFRLCLGVFCSNEFVGWATGNQESNETFYMRNSAILPYHRRKGLYTQLLQRTIELVSAQGFQKIHSRHTTANNSVIIPKLKAGFVITSIEISDIFGALVHLTYFPNLLRLKILNYRTGEIKPDDEIKTFLKI